MDDQRPPDTEQAAETPEPDEQAPPPEGCEECERPYPPDNELVAAAEPEPDDTEQQPAEAPPAPVSAPSSGPQLEIGVAFRHNTKVYSFGSGGLRLNIGDKVLVRTDKGVDLGDVVRIKGRMAPERAGELTPVVRLANSQDLAHVAEQHERERKALEKCAAKIAEHKLPMKLIDAHMSFDNTRLVFLFTAEGRVDFRDLVRDLAKTFRMRIELRQVGVRDEAKLMGGLGPCGRQLCCKMFMRNFEPVGIRIAKDQGLALNPAKLSGLCDRLMCCLRFEHETYLTNKARLPAKGTRVQTPDGPGVVTDLHVLAEQVTVGIGEGRDVTLPLAKVRPLAEGEEGQFVVLQSEQPPVRRAPERVVARPGGIHTRSKVATAEREEKPEPPAAEQAPASEEGREDRPSRRGKRRTRSRRKRARQPEKQAGAAGDQASDKPEPEPGSDRPQGTPAPAEGQPRRRPRRRRGGRRRSGQSAGGSQEVKS